MDLSSTSTDKTLKARASRVAAVAAQHADDVDKAGRFPKEAVDAIGVISGRRYALRRELRPMILLLLPQ